MSVWLDLLAEAYDLGKESTLWKRVRTRLRKKKRILVLGASGAGKTQFVNSLKDPLSYPLSSIQRTISVQRRKIIIDEYPFTLIDTPGQVLDEAKRKSAITHLIMQPIEGIINVVCFGFHEAAEAGGASAVATSKERIAKPAYLKKRRDVERDLLAEWVARIDPQDVRWVLTVVTKADLWWPDSGNIIKKYYEQGAYADRLDALRDIHHVAPYCSIIAPFYGTKTGGRFGDKERAAVRGHLLESIIRLTGVER